MKSCLLIITYIGIVCLPASSLQAQAPGWSRGQQLLAITYDEGIRRAATALQTEGYRLDYSAGAFSVGIKGVHTAVIMCNPAPDSRLTVNIVVASNGQGGGEERQRLQMRMDNPGTRPGGVITPTVTNVGGCMRSTTYGLTITPNSARVGQTVKIRYVYPGDKPGNGDWIGFFYPNTKTSYAGFWTYLISVKGCEYDFVVPNINLGPMQFRYILEGGYDKIMATAEFVVLP